MQNVVLGIVKRASLPQICPKFFLGYRHPAVAAHSDSAPRFSCATLANQVLPFRSMRKQDWMDALIRKIDGVLLVVVVVCIALGIVGHLIHFIRFGAIAAGSGEFY